MTHHNSYHSRSHRSHRPRSFSLLPRSPKWRFTLVALLLSGAILLALYAVMGQINYLAWALAVSLTTFIFYGMDKARARQSEGRIPEIVLHGLAIAGGAIGGWAGLFLFRHKTRHGEFYLILLLSTLLHLGLIYFGFVK